MIRRQLHPYALQDSFKLVGASGRTVSAIQHVSWLWHALCAEMPDWAKVFTDNKSCVVTNVPSLYGQPAVVDMSVTIHSIEQLQRCNAYCAYIEPRLHQHGVQFTLAVHLGDDFEHLAFTQETRVRSPASELLTFGGL